MNLKTIDLTGTKSTSVSLPPELFGAAVNPHILAAYVRIYLDRRRARTASALSRSAVKATTAKVWRQKGTGRARHGSRKAPIFVGGGQAHGPKSISPAKLNLPKKVKKQALISALSSKQKDTLIVTNFDQLDTKTKAISQALTQKLNWQPAQKLLLILHASTLPQIRSCRNLAGLSTTQASRLNPYEILQADRLVFTLQALDILKHKYSSSSEPLIATKRTASPKTNTSKPKSSGQS